MTVPISFIEITTRTVSKRNHATIMRDEVLREETRYHLYHTLGKHFKDIPETQPGGAYGYARRSPAYIQRKKRQTGQNLPNVLTGRSRRFVRNNSVVRATQHRSTLRIRFPFPMNEQRRKEMEAITSQEVNEMRTRSVRRYEKASTLPKYQSKRKVRI